MSPGEKHVEFNLLLQISTGQIKNRRLLIGIASINIKIKHAQKNGSK